MEVKEATEEDIPAIVNLLKLSLGESLMPKSERYWRWKHLENPFGASPVLLCWEGSTLIGIRAFMRWEWIQHGQIFRAVRAVDTATHPDYQGKGVFKKLTLALVDLCKQHGDHFVFNTPNKQSKPGYIKMGWQEAGRLPLRLSIKRPFTILQHYILNAPGPGTEHENDSLKYYLAHSKLAVLLAQHRQQMNTISTHVSVAYLTWRYLDVPVASYVAVGDEHGDDLAGVIIGRIKETRLGRELRITDCFFNGNSDGKELMRKFTSFQKESKIDYTTLSGTVCAHTKKLFRKFNISAAVGPIVTVRSLQQDDLHALKNFNQWSPSLGDLELF